MMKLLFFFLKMMKEAGIERRSSRGRATLSALNDLGSEGPGDYSFERHLDSLIEAQMRSSTQDEFVAFVNDLISRCGNDDGDEDSHMSDDEDE
jgi:hypothetical protein